MTDALLLTMMNPPVNGDEEFNAWADTEHLPERKDIPGIRTAIRFRNKAQSPRYMTAYDLEGLEVLASQPYKAIAGDNLSPWSKRILAGASARWRFEGTRIGNIENEMRTGINGRFTELLMVCWRGFTVRCDDDICSILDKKASVVPGVIQARAFVSNRNGLIDYVGLVESTQPFDSGLLVMKCHSVPFISCDFAEVFLPL